MNQYVVKQSSVLKNIGRLLFLCYNPIVRTDIYNRLGEDCDDLYNDASLQRSKYDLSNA